MLSDREKDAQQYQHKERSSSEATVKAQEEHGDRKKDIETKNERRKRNSSPGHEFRVKSNNLLTNRSACILQHTATK